jgi:hypothetical protein
MVRYVAVGGGSSGSVVVTPGGKVAMIRRKLWGKIVWLCLAQPNTADSQKDADCLARLRRTQPHTFQTRNVQVNHPRKRYNQLCPPYHLLDFL